LQSQSHQIGIYSFPRYATKQRQLRSPRTRLVAKDWKRTRSVPDSIHPLVGACFIRHSSPNECVYCFFPRFSTFAKPRRAPIGSTLPLFCFFSLSRSSRISVASLSDRSATRSAISLVVAIACTPCANWSMENSRPAEMFWRRCCRALGPEDDDVSSLS
jgi:hypothetical protein